MRLLSIAFVGLALAACAPDAGSGAVSGSVAPLSASSVTEDPIRSAIIDASAFFTHPRANQPAAAANAIADIEYLADAMPTNPRYQAAPGVSLTSLQLARQEGRTALGIAPNAPNGQVAAGLRDAAVALNAGDRAAAEAALPQDIFTLGPDQTISRLSQPPRVRNAVQAFAGLAAIQP
ncbi:hypothetical protein [Neoroseomonas lacus]|uniref:Uncharacterized protein n=1 Tax=Neoroseomonas lacus TaxID=287609 RepID=A0A917NYE3_9PROT|nr:hypothetical protein [Neoroseomonas lacus]GGJ40631.1 hypothetical protein GCM10011320_55410 [Neoroseomonas lacus]